MISAILLAAGESKRMGGENKLLKKINGIPLIIHTVKNILSTSISELIIVIGYQEKMMRDTINKDSKIKFVYNKDFKAGMSSSIKMGLKYISKKNNFFFICLGDMPMVDQNIYNEIIKHKNSNKIIVPTYNGRQGNPVLFSIVMKNKLMSINGDLGAKKILETNKEKNFNLEINNDAVVQDFDLKEKFN